MRSQVERKGGKLALGRRGRQSKEQKPMTWDFREKWVGGGPCHHRVRSPRMHGRWEGTLAITHLALPTMQGSGCPIQAHPKGWQP